VCDPTFIELSCEFGLLVKPRSTTVGLVECYGPGPPWGTRTVAEGN
jgi:hypothetical protein